jgi:hypothetical protein
VSTPLHLKSVRREASDGYGLMNNGGLDAADYNVITQVLDGHSHSP